MTSTRWPGAVIPRPRRAPVTDSAGHALSRERERRRLGGRLRHHAGYGYCLRRVSAVDLAAVLSACDEPWKPQSVARLNDYDIRVVRIHGEFTAHSHPEMDEFFFLVLGGTLSVRMKGR